MTAGTPVHRSSRTWRLAATLVVAGGLMGACGEDSPEVAEAPDTTTSVEGTDDTATTGGTDTTGATGGDAAIVVKDFAFEPTPLTAKVGQAISVRNDDDAPHTVTADDGSFDSGRIEGGAAGSVTPTKAGEITYHCEIHENMKGVIQVEA